MIGYDDNRNFFRMMVNSVCELKIVDEESSRSLQAVCRDISATGMSLEIEESTVEMGTKLNVYIESTNSQIPSFTADTKVVRCDAIDDNSCTVGVEIFELKYATFSRLISFSSMRYTVYRSTYSTLHTNPFK